MNRCFKNIILNNLRYSRFISSNVQIFAHTTARPLHVTHDRKRSSPSNAAHKSLDNSLAGQVRYYIARDTRKKDDHKKGAHASKSRYGQHEPPAAQNHRALKTVHVMKPPPSQNIEDIIKPVEVKPIPKMSDDVGKELCGPLDKKNINEALIAFRQDPKIFELARESGINARMFADALLSFRKFCLKSETLPPDLHIKLSDIILKSANVNDLYPFFLNHAFELYPHLNCMDELKQISDLTEPSYWYIEARDIKRKIIYHAGPTNSGKTYSALKSFQTSDSGIYCAPLKLLASEVCTKTNSLNAKCDLVTGEERTYADPSGQPSSHMACTVEMARLDKDYDVAIVDEIQMIRDQQRGWAWTRAFLGLRAKEIHVCGDKSAVDLISDLSFLTGDEFEVRSYDRLTSLTVQDRALVSFENVEPGDCIVCFNKKDIYNVTENLTRRGYETAVIYGSMPPGVKLAQAARFNDPEDKCKLLVATDAIGMGLNLNIRRIIFYDLKKPQHKERVENDPTSQSGLEMDFITTSQALQIAGRAGRFNTKYPDGFVTTMKTSDLAQLRAILNQPLPKITKAGLHPTLDQIELFSYQLPNQPLSTLLNIFTAICKIDSGQYFLCHFEDIKALAEQIDHIPVKLNAKYTFATSPINRNEPLIVSCFIKFVRSYSNNEPVTVSKLKQMIEFPFKVPKNIAEVHHLEVVYDVLDLYLWLSNRFPDIFCYPDDIKSMRSDLEEIIFKGSKQLSRLHQHHDPRGSPIRNHIKLSSNKSSPQDDNSTSKSRTSKDASALGMTRPEVPSTSAPKLSNQEENKIDPSKSSTRSAASNVPSQTKRSNQDTAQAVTKVNYQNGHLPDTTHPNTKMSAKASNVKPSDASNAKLSKSIDKSDSPTTDKMTDQSGLLPDVHQNTKMDPKASPSDKPSDASDTKLSTKENPNSQIKAKVNYQTLYDLCKE